MNETELEQNAQQIASTLINIHTESQEENKRMYDTMKGHVKAVWNGRQLGFLKSTSDTAEFPGRAELANALQQGWDRGNSSLKDFVNETVEHPRELSGASQGA